MIQDRRKLDDDAKAILREVAKEAARQAAAWALAEPSERKDQ